MSNDKKNPPKKAPLEKVVALQYDGDSAPLVTAKGQGEIAKAILAIAKENNIPLHQDPGLAALLSNVELGEEIPEALYVAVAKVLAFIYSLEGKDLRDLS